MPEVFMPRLSDTMTEGVLVRWLKHEGDQVRSGDVLAEIETDKATMELEAYDSGVLTRIIVEPGATVPIGEPLAVIGDEVDSAAQSAATPAAQPATKPDATAGPVDTPAPKTEPTAAPAGGTAPPTDSGADPGTPVREGRPMVMSPLVRSLARKHGLDLSGITGSGPGGRIVRADVEDAVAAKAKAPVPPASPTQPARPAAPPAAPPPAPSVLDAADDEELPLTSIRRITAQRLTESAAAPHFYLTSVVDAEPLLRLRSQLNTELSDTVGKLSVTDLIIRACAVSVRAHPQVNTSWAGDRLLRHGRVNIGCAVALDDGLIVPVVHDADRKSLTEIAAEVHRLTDRARAGKLTPDEFTGGTFTISNLGMFGIDHFTAVINPPEAAILAVGAAAQEAVVRDGQVVAATTMKLTLSIDHRVLDGATAAAFLRDLVDLLEHPLRIIA